jgi:hypothetical protein
VLRGVAEQEKTVMPALMVEGLDYLVKALLVLAVMDITAVILAPAELKVVVQVVGELLEVMVDVV